MSFANEIEKLRADPAYLEHASPQLRSHKESVLLAVEHEPSMIKYAHPTLAMDKEVAEMALRRGKQGKGGILSLVPFSVRDDKTLMLPRIQKYPHDFEFISVDLRDDKDVALVAVRACGQLLEYGFYNVKDDEKLVREAVENEQGRMDNEPEHLAYTPFKFASQRLKNDFNAVLHAVQHNGHSIMHASKELQSNPVLAARAVEQDGLALQHFSDELRGNKDFVLKAVKSEALALKFASNQLREDLDVLDQAMCSYLHQEVILENMSDVFNSDFQKAKKLAERIPWAIFNLSSTLQDNRELVMIAVKSDAEVIMHVEDRFKDDEEIALEAVKQDGYMYRYLGSKAQSNVRVVIEAFKNAPAMQTSIPEAMLKNSTVCVLLGIKLDLAADGIRQRKRTNNMTQEEFEEVVDAATHAAKRHRAALTQTSAILSSVM